MSGTGRLAPLKPKAEEGEEGGGLGGRRRRRRFRRGQPTPDAEPAPVQVEEIEEPPVTPDADPVEDEPVEQFDRSSRSRRRRRQPLAVREQEEEEEEEEMKANSDDQEDSTLLQPRTRTVLEEKDDYDHPQQQQIYFPPSVPILKPSGCWPWSAVFAGIVVVIGALVLFQVVCLFQQSCFSEDPAVLPFISNGGVPILGVVLLAGVLSIAAIYSSKQAAMLGAIFLLGAVLVFLMVVAFIGFMYSDDLDVLDMAKEIYPDMDAVGRLAYNTTADLASSLETHLLVASWSAFAMCLLVLLSCCTSTCVWMQQLQGADPCGGCLPR